jgi:hypothetical protein
MSLLLDNVYFNGIIQGRSNLYRKPVRAASIGNITLSGLQTIDTVVLSEGDRVLVRAQTDRKENGIYNASSGSWTRAQDFATGDNVSGVNVFVTEGSSYRRNYIYCTNVLGSDVIGTANIIFDRATYSISTVTSFNKSLDDTTTTIAAGTKIAKFDTSNITSGQTRTFTFPTGAAAGNLMTKDSTSGLSNKSFDDATTYFINATDNTKRLQFQASGITSASTKTFTVPNVTGTLVLDSATQTLTSTASNLISFTTPIIDTIYNTSSEKVLDLSGASSAVNYLDFYASNDSSAFTRIAAKGSDAAVNLQFKTKGTGSIDIRSGAGNNAYATYWHTARNKQAKLATTSGLTSNISITLPSIGSSTKKVLRLNASNQLEYSNDRVTYTLSSTSHRVSKTAFLIPTSIFVWNNAFYGTSGSFRFEDGYATYIYTSDLASIGRVITVDLYNVVSGTVLGTNSTTISLAGTHQVRFNFTLPTSDAILQFRASATGINGVTDLFAGSLDFGKY